MAQRLSTPPFGPVRSVKSMRTDVGASSSLARAWRTRRAKRPRRIGSVTIPSMSMAMSADVSFLAMIPPRSGRSSPRRPNPAFSKGNAGPLPGSHPPRGDVLSLSALLLLGHIALDLPAVLRALAEDLVGASDLLVRRLLDAQRATDLVDDVLVRRGHAAADGLLAGPFRPHPVGIEIAAAQRGAGLVMERHLVRQLREVPRILDGSAAAHRARLRPGRGPLPLRGGG